jgi:hypothetical protein
MDNAGTMTGSALDNSNANSEELLKKTCDLATAFFAGLRERPVGRPVDYSAMLANMGGPLPLEGEDPLHVVQHLSTVADPGLVATAGPRHFGFVIGGSLPAALAAEWLAAFVEIHSFLGMGGYLDHLHSQRGRAFQNSEIGRALDRDHVPRLRHRSKA